MVVTGAATLGMLVLTCVALWSLGLVTTLAGAFILGVMGLLAMALARSGRVLIAGLVTGGLVVSSLCMSGVGFCVAAIQRATPNDVALTPIVAPDGIGYLEHPRLHFVLPHPGPGFATDPVMTRAHALTASFQGDDAEVWAYVSGDAIEISIHSYLVPHGSAPDAFTRGFLGPFVERGLASPVRAPTYEVDADGVHEIWLRADAASGDSARSVHALLWEQGRRRAVVAMVRHHPEDDWTSWLAGMHAPDRPWRGPYACPLTDCARVDLRTARSSYLDRPPIDVVPAGDPLPPDPDGVFDVVTYAGPLGPTCAYATRRVPREPTAAVLYLHGGFTLDGDIGPESPARHLADAGLVVLAPCMRGEHDAPGDLQLFLDEVDDARAALDHLRQMPGVDPVRTFVVGHSSGGTTTIQLAELGAPATAFYAFGPLSDPIDLAGSPDWFDAPPYELRDPRARWIRAPIHFVSGIDVPTYVIEGETGNAFAAFSYAAMAASVPEVRVIVAEGDHGSLLAPVIGFLAPQMMRGDPPPTVAAIVEGAALSVVRE